MSHYIERPEQLRDLYPEPSGRTVGKQLRRLDGHCRHFISLSPFVVIASSDGRGLDTSPRGGPAGFVTVFDDATLWIPDAPGNNRLDSLTNIVTTGRVGLLFMIPGVDETLRVNGGARVAVDPVVLERCTNGERKPKVVIEVTVEEAYLHCAKSLMRSRLWSDDTRVPRTALPTMGEMLADQLGTSGPVETREEMVARYSREL